MVKAWNQPSAAHGVPEGHVEKGSPWGESMSLFLHFFK